MTSILRAALSAAACAWGLAFAPFAAAQQTSVPAQITIHADTPGAQINRYIFGQFAEHLGRDIYDGIWVGPNSPIPNTRGFRNDVVQALRAIHVPIVRWPGGCFADWYHWRDGIGPRAARPTRVNTNWGGVEESNAVGTHEYFDFINQIGADSYVNFNIGTGTPQEMADWVEYMTSASHSTLANERRRNGRADPWKLNVVTIGNETWGCGGNMRPEYYADLYTHYATFLSTPDGNHPIRVASGGYGDKPEWTEAMMAHAGALAHMDAISLHQYTLPSNSWTGPKGPALGFGEDQWMSMMAGSLRLDDILTRHSAIMDRYDPQKRVGLYVDEWGAWYDAAPDAHGILFQQNTLRDALVAAIHFNVFEKHADRVRMASVAQVANVLQSMVLTDGPRMLRTPTYHVFAMYTPFMDATLLPSDVTAPPYRLGDASVPMLSVSAARGADGKMYVALVNLDPHRDLNVTGRIAGANASTVTGQIITAAAMDAHNTFDAPDTLVPVAFSGAAVSRDRLTVNLPAKSVVVLAIN